MKLRNYSVDGSGNRSGETRIEFLRRNPNESFGSNECSDWMIGANSLCGFDIYRKATHPSLGVLYNGTVLEFDQDGDVNCVKVGGLKVNGNEVATKSYTDTTFATIGVEQSVSDLSSASSSHGNRLTTIENAGYATTSQLSTYATASSLGDTNTTVGGINTRVNTLENSGFVTSDGLGGYNFATQGYVQSALPDVSNFMTSSTLSTNHYTKGETDTAIPTTTDILNNTNVGATATSGATAGVTVTNKSSGSGVDLNFTIPPGEQGEQGIQGEQGEAGADATLGNLTGLTMSHNATIVDKRSVTTTSNYNQALNYSHYASVAQGNSRNPDNARGLWVGNMVDENDSSPSGANFIAFTNSLTFYGNADRTSYGDALSFTSNTDKLKYDGTEFSKLSHINSNGNVGIGTTNPGFKLEVNGTSRFTGTASCVSVNASGTVTATAITCYNASDSSVSHISAYGSSQGTGRLYVGQKIFYGGGIEYNGDNNPTSTGAGADYITLFRRNNDADAWTARNSYASNNWEFRGNLKAAYNQNVTSYFGRAAIGYAGFSDYASFSHLDRSNTTDYALLQSTGGTTYLNCNSSQSIRFRSGNSDKMRMLANGNFGIGITSPSYKLQVNGLIYGSGGCRIYGEERYTNYTNSESDYLTNGGNVQVDPPSLSFGLYVDRSINAAGIVVFSDQRIKSDVVDINDTTALDQIRLLKPKYYEYVDKVAWGSSSVIGFIAQEVKEVLPRAVSVADGEIPNIYEMVTISSNNTITFTNFNTSNLEGTNCTLIAYLPKDERKEVTITEVVDEHTVRVEEDMSEWGAELFVWGQKVDDFHHLNKDYMWTVATSALQEVDIQLLAEKTRNDALEARILALESA
jgi:hypothetical protein